MNNYYSWEAELIDGSVITDTADISSAIRFSFIPQKESLPRHDIIGIKLNRRFNRGFINALNGGELREYLLCVVAENFRIYVKSSDGTLLVTPVDYEVYL